MFISREFIVWHRRQKVDKHLKDTVMSTNEACEVRIQNSSGAKEGLIWFRRITKAFLEGKNVYR